MILQPYLIHLLTFTGLAAGYIIAHYTWDEHKLGEKYFKLIKTTLLILIAIFTFTLNHYTHTHLILLLGGFLFGYLLKLPILYLGMAGVLSIALGNPLPLAALIFLYLLPEGTLTYYKYKTPSLMKHTALMLLLFFLPVILFVHPTLTILTSFTTGALIAQLT